MSSIFLEILLCWKSIQTFFFCRNLENFNDFWWKPDSCGLPGSLLCWFQEISPKKSESSALLQSFHFFPCNENQMSTLNTLLKCCLPSTDAIKRWETFTYGYKGSRSSDASADNWNPPSFWKKKRLNTFLPKQNLCCLLGHTRGTYTPVPFVLEVMSKSLVLRFFEDG